MRQSSHQSSREARAILAGLLYQRAAVLGTVHAAAREAGFSRQYAHQILREAGCPTRVPKLSKLAAATKLCARCLNPIPTGRSRFCSDSCKNAYRYEERIPENKRTCAYCGADFFRRDMRSRAEGLGKTKPWHCNRHCYAASQHANRKLCPDCYVRKPAKEFYRDRRRADGLSQYCKSCKTARNKSYFRAVYYPQHREALIAKVQSRRRRTAENGQPDA